MPDERDLTPEQEARVARLLADARADEPMPPEIAERLDRVLAGLADQPAPHPPEKHTPAVDLAARRRRRAGSLLLAAAAVVVAGLGVGQLVDTQGDGQDAGQGATADGAGDESALERRAQPEGESAEDHGMSPEELASLGPPTRINTRSFGKVVRRLQDEPGVSSYAADGLMEDRDLAAPRTGFRCAPTDFGAGKLIAVTYNGSPAVLAYRPPAGGTQVVDLMQCRSGDILRSTTIPLP